MASAQHLTLIRSALILDDRIAENTIVHCREGRIVAIEEATLLSESKIDEIPSESIVDLEGRYLAPGFVDIHVHGGNGADFMDGTADAIQIAASAHARHGTTTIFPTTTTGSAAQIHAMLAACQETFADQQAGLPRAPGIHLYGPFFAENKVGCHDVDGRRDPLPEEFDAYFDTGFVRIATCAAELPGAENFYRKARDTGCLITCGHSNASWPEMVKAFDAGVRHVDHFWCAMSSVPSLRQRFGTPMQASMAEFVLAHQAMSTEVIADACHLSPELLEFAYQVIGPDRLCLVTDCNRALDLPVGEYRFGNQDSGSWFYSDGEVGWAIDRSSLASSVKGMDHMVKIMATQTSATLPEVIRMASLTPARRTGVDGQVGSVEIGKAADLVVLNEALDLERVFIGGQEVEPPQNVA